MFSIIVQEENANQDHNEILLYTQIDDWSNFKNLTISSVAEGVASQKCISFWWGIN